MYKIGLIVNPVAGMGGRLGLKGTDGYETLCRAREMGAMQLSPIRTIVALEHLKKHKDKFQIYTCSGEMGEIEAEKTRLPFSVIFQANDLHTTPEDTLSAAAKLRQAGIDLLLFAGGDGTARDIYNAIGDSLPVIGIPAGVKIHSAVYASSPARSGELASLYVSGQIKVTKELEIMDIDEDAFRQGRVQARLFGYMKVPFERRFIQGKKSGGGRNDLVELDSIANFIVANMQENVVYIIGSGTTTRAISQKMGLDYSLLGIDALRDREILDLDLNERDLLKIIEPGNTKLIVTVIGGQGHILGRGNQQLSPEVIRKIGKENMIVAATPEKLTTLYGKSLLVDTGDEKLDQELSGYIPVITGFREQQILKVEC